MDIAQALVPAALGLLSGVVGSLIAPWVHWGIESRRERRSNQKSLLAEARLILSEPPQLDEFRRLPIYSRIFELVTDETRQTLTGRFDKIGKPIIVVALGGPFPGFNPYAHKVLVDLAAKEREWGLM